MAEPAETDASRILSDGGPGATEALLPLVYAQLRAIASQRMGHERTGHTLTATALVHEAYLRLMGEHNPGWASRAHFFHAAAEAMRRILVEHARAAGRLKRGGGRSREPMTVVDLAADQDPTQILALDAAMRQLENEDAGAADVVRLRFFAGLGVKDTAAALGISERTVKREWVYARSKLFRIITDG